MSENVLGFWGSAAVEKDSKGGEIRDDTLDPCQVTARGAKNEK